MLPSALSVEHSTGLVDVALTSAHRSLIADSARVCEYRSMANEITRRDFVPIREVDDAHVSKVI